MIFAHEIKFSTTNDRKLKFFKKVIERINNNKTAK